jgi:translocation protein SEC62
MKALAKYNEGKKKDAPEPREIMNRMFEEGMIVPVEKADDKKHVKMSAAVSFSEESIYALTYTPMHFSQHIGSGLLVVVPLTLCMYPLWPSSMHTLVWYLSVLSMMLIVLLVVVGVVRLVVYLLTMFTIKRGLWILPNLFMDVDFLDSFVPMYEWESEQTLQNGEQVEIQKDIGNTAIETVSK